MFERLFYLRKRRLFLRSLCMVVIFPLLFSIFIIYILKAQVGGYLLSIFEKKTIDNLTSYHESVQRSVDSYFVRSIKLLENIGRSDHFSLAHYVDNPRDIDDELRLQLSLNPQFYTLGIMDLKGVVQHVVSRQQNVEELQGKNLSDRDYFQQVLKTGKTFVSKPMIGIISKNSEINISVPMFQNGKIVSVLNGFISLKQLTTDMNISTPFYDKYSILADIDGTILTGNIPDKEKLINVADKEPLFSRVQHSKGHIYMTDDYNYRGDRVFALGERISIMGDKDILLLCFLKKDGFAGEQSGLDYTIYKTAAYLIFLWLMLNAALFMVLSVLFYYHDKN